MKKTRVTVLAVICTTCMSMFLGCTLPEEGLKSKIESKGGSLYSVCQNFKLCEQKESDGSSGIIKKLDITPLHSSDKIQFDIIGESGLGENIAFQKFYTEMEGVTTFRGNNYRSSPSYGTVSMKEKRLQKRWSFTTSSSSWGGGAGWTGQPVIVRWPKNVKSHMNLKDEFKNKGDFTEVIYASLDGNIYFMDLDTGRASREKIYAGNPIKGSPAIDQRGIPLLYVGEGINENGPVGFNIYSLIDGRKLYEINGYDSYAYRGWPAFDSSPIINSGTDTLIEGGENGLLYIVKLNSSYDGKEDISVNPEITRYRYRISGSKGLLGIENSVAVYGNLAYFADNNGYIQCINLNTLKPVWAFDGKDDTDASITIEAERGIPYIYSGNEVDIQGQRGTSILKKINGITGKSVWEKPVECQSLIGNNPVNGGLLATNVIGKNDMSHLVVFPMARYKGFNKGGILALNKNDGSIEWENDIDNYIWSSPLDFYDDDGRGYIIQCDSAGNIMLIDGKNGRMLHSINLGANIESSPAMFEGKAVIATRGGHIWCVEVE